MNNVTCGIAEDLLPLYMDGCCSKDSRQAVEEHMRTCENAEKISSFAEHFAYHYIRNVRHKDG